MRSTGRGEGWSLKDPSPGSCRSAPRSTLSLKGRGFDPTTHFAPTHHSFVFVRMNSRPSATAGVAWAGSPSLFRATSS